MKWAVAALVLALVSSSALVHAQDAPSAQVATVLPRQAVIGPQVVAYGSVTLASDRQTDISLPYAAQITRLSVAAGRAVRRGDVLFVATADPAAVLAARQAQNAAQLARGDVERTRALLAQHLATQAQLAAAEKALADAEQALAAQRALGADAGERTVRAPDDGVVLKLAAAQGDRVAAGAVVLQLGRTGGAAPAHVTLGLDPALRRLVPVGAPVTLTSLANAAGSNPPALHGRVSRIQAAVDAKTHLIDATVDVAAGDGAALIPGEAVRGTIALPGKEHWVVPRLAVLRDDRGAYVYQIDQGKAHRVAVEVRVDNGEQLGIDGPLQARLPLVVQGNYELTDGMAVREAQQ